MKLIHIIYSPELKMYLKGDIMDDPQWTENINEACEIGPGWIETERILEWILEVRQSDAVNCLEIKSIYKKNEPVLV